MTVVGTTKERDERIFGTLTRDKIYRGDDRSLTSKSEITSVPPQDIGVKPLIGKFSTYDLNRMLPEQRKQFLAQMRYEISLSGTQLNDYLSKRYSTEDMYMVWKLQQGPKRVSTKRKQSNSAKARRRQLSPEVQAQKVAKYRATMERVRNDPDHISYAQLQAEFKRRQKLLAKRYENWLKEGVEKYSEQIIRKRVDKATRKLYRENKQLIEFIRMNGLSPPNSAKDKQRRQAMREDL